MPDALGQSLQHANHRHTVGEIGIAAAVPAVFRRADPRDLVGRYQHACGAEVADQQVALGVDVRADMMGDGTGVVAQADAAVEAGSAQPERAAVVADGICLPEADVVAPVGAVADGLFESEVLGAAFKQQAADRRIGIGSGEQDALADVDRCPERDGVGRVSAGHGKSVDHLLLGADKSDIDRVAGNALRRMRHHLEALRAEAVLPPGPEFRRGKVGKAKIESTESRQPDRRASPKASLTHERPLPSLCPATLCGVGPVGQ